MTSHLTIADQNSIVVGSPLPFSVYSGDRKLLLAKGQIVESERARDVLVQVGRFHSSGSALELAAPDGAPPQPPSENPLEIYWREHHAVGGNSRVSIRLSRDDSSESFPCWVVGADEQHGLIVTAPVAVDGSPVAVSEGEIWVFRIIYLTAAVKFRGIIRKTQFEPVPMLSVSLPQQIEMRHVRAGPRIDICLHGHIEVGKEIPMLITDLSISGMRIVVERSQCELKAGQHLSARFTLNMLGRDYNLKVLATVVSKKQEVDKRYPSLLTTALMIEAQADIEKLVLHSYVYERMAMDFNPLWKLLVRP